jgi:hypothetical protein
MQTSLLLFDPDETNEQIIEQPEKVITKNSESRMTGKELQKKIDKIFKEGNTGNPDSKNGLSSPAQKLLDDLKSQYLKGGPHPSNAFVYLDQGNQNTVSELLSHELLEKRNCAASNIYDLHKKIRADIVKKEGLENIKAKWMNVLKSSFNIDHEIRILKDCLK